MSGIFWLASYPKSGNTWLRAFLTNYWRDGDAAADINDLDAGPIVSSRAVLDEWLGMESSDLTWEEIEHYRPLVHERMAASSSEPIFIKVHDAFTRNSEGLPLFPKTATAGVIYLIRNPLDVAVSYAHHADRPVDEIIGWMGSDTHAMKAADGKLYDQLPERLLSWSGHVRSWVDEPDLNVHVVRYEDMANRPLTTFSGIVRFARLTVDAERIRVALERSQFDRLQAQEAAHGFAVKQPTAESFFRKGRVGSWRGSLTERQVQELVRNHDEVMCRYGYLNGAERIDY